MEVFAIADEAGTIDEFDEDNNTPSAIVTNRAPMHPGDWDEDGDVDLYDFAQNIVPGATERDRGYWRDVGTLDSYYDANMDLVSVHPVFNLYNRHWPIHTSSRSLPPAKFVFDEHDRRGMAVQSMVSAGAIVAIAAGAWYLTRDASPQAQLEERWTFVEQYCVDCHNDAEFAGEFSFEGMNAADVHANAQLFEDVEEERGRLKAILSSTNDIVIVVDAHGYVLLSNPE